MTPKQSELLGHLERLTVDGVPPTYETLRVVMGYANRSRIHGLMHGLAERGVVSISPRKRTSVAIRSHDAEAIPFDQMAEAVWEFVELSDGKRIRPAHIRQVMLSAYAGAAA